MKVFISHQRADAGVATQISERLRICHQIPSYLDVIDAQMGKAGDDLSAYIRREISKCTHLIAVTSILTRTSQWVPWEIGIATEKEYPLATFADYTSDVPEFLKSWPYLRDMSDLDKYARAAKNSENTYILRKSYVTDSVARTERYNQFFLNLRKDLGQPTSRASW